MIAIQNAAPQESPGSISGEAKSRITDVPAAAASALDILVDATPSYSQERKELMALRSQLEMAVYSLQRISNGHSSANRFAELALNSIERMKS